MVESMNNRAPESKLTLVLMAGMPGAGKTTPALALGRSLGWPVIDKDSLKSPMLTKGISNDLAGPASYALMLAMADDLLVRQRLSAILDSPGRFPDHSSPCHSERSEESRLPHGDSSLRSE